MSEKRKKGKSYQTAPLLNKTAVGNFLEERHLEDVPFTFHLQLESRASNEKQCFYGVIVEIYRPSRCQMSVKDRLEHLSKNFDKCGIIKDECVVCR